jgi:hypothetical protein
MQVLCAAVSAWGAQLTLKTADKGPPEGVAEPIAKGLESKAIQVLDGDKVVYEFWFRKDLPVKAKPDSTAKALDNLEEMSLMGIAVVGEGRRDYKDNEIAPGAYTMRFGLQPQDGDHLGTSEFPYFAVLIPAKVDTEPAGIKTFKSMVKASSKGTASGHPVVLSLRPVQKQAGDSPALSEPAPDHKAIDLRVPAKAAGSDPAFPISFEIVVQGRFKS